VLRDALLRNAPQHEEIFCVCGAAMFLPLIPRACCPSPRDGAAALAEQLRMPRMQQQNERQRLHVENFPGLHARPKISKR
jgi:hypothetical protein